MKPNSPDGSMRAFATRLATVNVLLVLFNLIPAFPMDGGRVLRAPLILPLGRQRATAISARIGQGLAFVFGFLGLIGGNAILVFIAIFVYIAAAAEAGEATLREVARRVPVDRAMIRVFETLPPSATVDDAVDARRSDRQRGLRFTPTVAGCRRTQRRLRSGTAVPQIRAWRQRKTISAAFTQMAKAYPTITPRP